MWAEARIWFDELVRELEIVASRTGAPQPQAFLELVAEMRRLRDVTGDQGRLDAALLSDRDHVDIVFEVPPEAGPLARELWKRYLEVADYCRSGGLLTTAAPPHIEQFVGWFLDTVSRQADGEPPTPWNGSADSQELVDSGDV